MGRRSISATSYRIMLLVRCQIDPGCAMSSALGLACPADLPRLAALYDAHYGAQPGHVRRTACWWASRVVGRPLRTAPQARPSRPDDQRTPGLGMPEVPRATKSGKIMARAGLRRTS